MEITQEYLDKSLDNLLEKVRTELKEQTKELKDYTHQAFEIQQDWMDERFKELIVAYDVRERVGALEKDVAHLKLGRKAHA